MKIKTALTDWMFLLAELAKEIQSAGAVFIIIDNYETHRQRRVNCKKFTKD